ncbi:secreted RxLR effector peptide protein, putative [Phytophthora infestans T30-4]|uniref:RxLR effector protein n=1 Tax=Phytophthora infestans (strain T30-4) TaxID=403677 RepID=D0P1F5_PHYIT|nr:secreted RxLR effector peptide protein, putative [Phytophthora infestans T30-4]EEY54577.1 secreted RxLR effector peptide protein, putative [Phytophthora infestans T30-4]|eukprot:XP_002895857.1 secreted RxLR effector peptide protein, putative [Phytophthora infestans T30-4]
MPSISPLQCTLLFVALAFFANVATSSDAMEVKILSGNSDLLVTSSADITGGTTAKRFLRQAAKASQKSVNYPSHDSESVAAEERGWFTNLFGRIENASESTFKKLLGSGKAKLKAFEKLEKKNTLTQGRPIWISVALICIQEAPSGNSLNNLVIGTIKDPSRRPKTWRVTSSVLTRALCDATQDCKGRTGFFSLTHYVHAAVVGNV